MPIRALGITKCFGTPPTEVLHDISLELKDGELVSLTGRSGSGKSTLLYLLSTLDTPNAGYVEIGGIDVKAMSRRELHRFRNKKMGFVFQFHYLINELTALENVLMPAMKAGEASRRRIEAITLLKEFGLGEKLDRLPTQLSGGEQQRVAIARALVMSPQFIFADEPTGNLDSLNGEIVMALLKKINRERGTTVVFVTHDPAFAATAQRQVQLVDGRIASDQARLGIPR